MTRTIRVFLVFGLAMMVAGSLAPAAAETPATDARRGVVALHSLRTAGGPLTGDWSRARIENVSPAEMPDLAHSDIPSFEDPAGVAQSVAGDAESPEVRMPLRMAKMRRMESLGDYQSFEILDTQAPGNRTAGRIIARNANGTWSCSGTVVTSESESLVMTAAHCLYDTETGQWATRVDFMPGYRNGSTPYGVWTGSDASVLSGYLSGGNPEHDLGAFRVAPLNGLTIQDVTGSRGYLFNESGPQQFQAFGYPAAPPFTGALLWTCISASGQRMSLGSGPDMVSMGCDMTGGSSGGGWIVGGDRINSVVSGSIDSIPETLFGPYFGTAAQALWSTVGGGGTDPDPDPDPDPTDPVTHQMRLTLKLSGGLVASGRMTSADRYLPCTIGAPVVIGKKTSAGWKPVGEPQRTNAEGKYRMRLPNKRGRYVAVSPEGSVDEFNLCSSAESPIRRY